MNTAKNWKQGHGLQLIAPNGTEFDFIAKYPDTTGTLANKRLHDEYIPLIVRAVNAHDELLLAVKSSYELVNDYTNLLPRDAHDAAMFRRHLTGLKAAIAKAEGR